MEFVWLIAGFILLIKGADWMVQSASRLARSFGVSTMVIGLTVVALGTSMPEAAIGIMSAINHANQLTLGDVIGSSVANIALIIGFSAILRPLEIQPRTMSRDIPLSILIQVVFSVFLLTGKGIGRLESSILLAGFISFIIYLARSSRPSRILLLDSQNDYGPEEKPAAVKRWRAFLITLIGMAGVIGGSKLVVDSSIKIATSFGLSEAMIGVTIVALGTSLPELVVSIVSASRKEHELMVGNIIGSNIFNILFVIGISATINPIAYVSRTWVNLLLMMITSVLFLIMAHRNKRISRPEGILLLCFYLFFFILAIFTS
ncbi:MAG: calcium/sodium antiporter [Saccharofermentanales bacterium]